MRSLNSRGQNAGIRDLSEAELDRVCGGSFVEGLHDIRHGVGQILEGAGDIAHGSFGEGLHDIRHGVGQILEGAGDLIHH